VSRRADADRALRGAAARRRRRHETTRPPPSAGYVRPRQLAWGELLRRTCAIGVLTCPECGGRRRLVATIADRTVIETILLVTGRRPARPP
jgi:hypothetical protein